jgi:undecaprenyl-diphosphatase
MRPAAPTPAPIMTPLQSFILGIIEGITEYLPISSTGHLIVAQRLMGLGNGVDKEASDAFAICIQGGAIAAVLGLYWPRVLQMIRGLFGKDAEGLRLVLAMICGFLPAAVLGLSFNSWIKQHLFGLVPVVIAWIVGGVAILAVAKYRKRRRASGTHGVDLAEITWKMALIIGFMQCVAMWPGTSRSLMTIVGGVLVGMNLRSAVEFSFLLGVLTLGAATCKDGMDSGALMLELYGPMNLAIGFIAAMVSAALAVKWLVGYLQRHGMEVFGWYRIAVGLVVGGLLVSGVIAAT